ncbi:MAG TPA: 4Fe-4S ferredoxin [Desulfobacteraceae bacterium]|nr:4Fe-4S ferredoxin [Desulfobacteraceae bacterium]
MIETIKQHVAGLLTEKKIAGFLGLIEKNGHVAPHLFKDGESLAGFTLGDRKTAGDARYPLNKTLVTLSRAYPEETFGVLVRGCDERGLYGLFRLNQLTEDRVIPVGFSCPAELSEACECRKPYPDSLVAGEKTESSQLKKVAEMDGKDLARRFDFWTAQFVKCVKCYGCRDVCPMCFCKECSLECEDLVAKGDLPVEVPVFHLTRAMHMADRCVDCGLCDEACPSDIPLRLLYKKTAQIMDTDYGFTSGLNKNERSPLSQMGPAK